MDNAFIERIEVPKGPSTIISGVSSFGGRGGVVNLVRKEAGGEPHRNALINLDSRDSGTVRAEADLAGQVEQGPAWRLVAYGGAFRAHRWWLRRRRRRRVAGLAELPPPGPDHHADLARRPAPHHPRAHQPRRLAGPGGPHLTRGRRTGGPTGCRRPAAGRIGRCRTGPGVADASAMARDAQDPRRGGGRRPAPAHPAGAQAGAAHLPGGVQHSRAGWLGMSRPDRSSTSCCWAWTWRTGACGSSMR